jgi:hypothetical protein
MSYSLAQIILAAGNIDGEDTIWIQMLVLVILVALLGVGSLVKTRVSSFKDEQQNYPEGGGASYTWLHRLIKPLRELRDTRLGILTAQSKATIEEPLFGFDAPDITGQQKPKDEPDREGGRDLAGGMEMLKLDFLLSVVENAEGDDKNDVMMRKLNFNELLRREQLNEIDGNALKVYAVDEGNLYGKDIQFQAMKELAVRTTHKGKHSG